MSVKPSTSIQLGGRVTKRLTLPTLSPERRRDLLRLPGLSHWAMLALQREHVEIDCRLDDLDLAVQQKLNPEIGAWRYHADRPAGQRIERFATFKPGQALKKRATLALDEAIKPRRTGGKRGRPSLGVHSVVVAILACFEAHRRYHDERRLQTVVIDHLQASVHRRLTMGERSSVTRDLEVITEARGRSVDWRAWLRKWRHALKKSDTE